VRSDRSVFGSVPDRRPDMLTNAETVLMPWLRNSRPDDPADLAETRPLLRVAAAPPRPATTSRTTMISRLVLLAILILQAALSLRLRNTAFEDEATYLYAGHMELQHLLHGAALQGSYSSYFSGAPVLYPVAAAFLDQIGGLALARALSLAEMLTVTTLLYMLTRRLFNERAALCAAALFAVTEATVFLGNFATYDATCLFLLALAAWITVRTAPSRRPLFLLAAVPAALAVAVKYAGLLFVPTIAVLPALAGWPERGRRVLWYPPAFAAAVAGLLYVALRLGGTAYATALGSTTTNRAQGTVPAGTILRESLTWGGVLFLAAVIGTIAYVRRVRTEPDEKIAPAGGRWRRAALGVTLTGTALLAPAYQAHLHTDISFLKHIGFGLFFAAPMAGFGLARIMGDYFRRPLVGIAVWTLALTLGAGQSSALYHVWPQSGPFVRTFSKYLKPDARYLVEVPEVPIYYLMGNRDAQPRQFTSTYDIAYTSARGRTLTGPAGFTAAVKSGYFQVIAYSNTVTPAADAVIAKALQASHSYRLASRVRLSDASGPVTYDIWVKSRRLPRGRMPHVDGQLPVPLQLRRRPRRLVDHQALDRHRVRRQPDGRDVDVPPRRYLQAHVVEQAAHVGHGHVFRPPPLQSQSAGSRRAARRVSARVPRDLQVGRFQPGAVRVAPWLTQVPAGAPEAYRLVVALPAHRIAEHLPRLLQQALRQGDPLDHVRRGTRDQLRPQQARLGVVLTPDLRRLGAGQHAKDVIPGDPGLHGAQPTGSCSARSSSATCAPPASRRSRAPRLAAGNSAPRCQKSHRSPRSRSGRTSRCR